MTESLKEMLDKAAVRLLQKSLLGESLEDPQAQEGQAALLREHVAAFNASANWYKIRGGASEDAPKESQFGKLKSEFHAPGSSPTGKRRGRTAKTGQAAAGQPVDVSGVQ